MPSRYYCVQQALSKMTEEAEQNFSSVGGQKFSKRIESNSSSKVSLFFTVLLIYWQMIFVVLHILTQLREMAVLCRLCTRC